MKKSYFFKTIKIKDYSDNSQDLAVKNKPLFKFKQEHIKIFMSYLLLLTFVSLGIVSLLLLTNNIFLYDRIKVNGKKVYVAINLISNLQLQHKLSIGILTSSTIGLTSLLFFSNFKNLYKEIFINTLAGIILILSITFLFGIDNPKYNKNITYFIAINAFILIGYILHSYLTIFLKNNEKRTIFSIRQLTESSILVAVAVLFSFLADLIMPRFPASMGGFRISITYLPLMIIALRCGPLYGGLSGLIYGMFNVFLDGGFSHIGSLFLDYAIPYSFFALMGLFPKLTTRNFSSGIVFVLMLCGITCVPIYLSHSLSGILFFKEYAPEGINPYVYSFVFVNLPAVLLKMVICFLLYMPLHNVLVSKEKRVV